MRRSYHPFSNYPSSDRDTLYKRYLYDAGSLLAINPQPVLATARARVILTLLNAITRWLSPDYTRASRQ